MPLLKAPNLRTQPSLFSMADIEQRAVALVAGARAQAEGLLADAAREADRLKAEAKKAGHAEGRAAGLAEGRKQGAAEARAQALKEHKAQLDQLAKTLSAAIAEVDSARQALDAEARQGVLEFSLALARKVAHRVGVQDPRVVEANVQAALSMAQGRQKVRLGVHPTQRDLIEQALPALKQQFSQLHSIEVADDPSVAPGGCRLATGGGEINADLDAQLDRIAAELLPDRHEQAEIRPAGEQRLWPEDLID